MNTTLARDLALSLMAHYQLSNWTFKFNRKKSSFGVCYFFQQRIELSSVLVECNSLDQVRDTILHEIAHAIAFTLYNDCAHGIHWQEVCKIIGAKPERFADESAIHAKPKYYMINHETGEKLSSYHRLPNWHKEVGLRFVNGKRKETIGKLRFIPA